MASKKMMRRRRRPKTVVTRSVQRRYEIVVGRRRIVLIRVCVMHHGSDPGTITCHVGDLIEFMNCSGKRQVSIHFDVSPFLSKNPPQTIIVGAVPVVCRVVGPGGFYTSEAVATTSTSTPPDGPAVIVQ